MSLNDSIIKIIKAYPEIVRYLSDKSIRLIAIDSVKQIDYDAFKNRLERDLAKYFGVSLNELLKLLGDGYDLRNIPEEFWTAYSAGLQRTIEPNLEATAEASGLSLQKDIQKNYL